jgi:hypothetical protein
MIAKTVTGYHGFNPVNECFMILIKRHKHGSFDRVLFENGKSYYTYHTCEADEKVKKLNIEFKQPSLV